jgi:PPM family protein phosphatase
VRPADVRVVAGGATHIGQRTTNADGFLLDEQAGLYGVSDGIGDIGCSRLAAETALSAVAALFQEGWAALPARDRSVNDARFRLRMGMLSAHGRIFNHQWRDRSGPVGATFAGVVVCGEQLALGHTGDSRVYLLRGKDGRLVQVTQDHTVLAEAILHGMPAPGAMALPDARHLTQALGVRRALAPCPTALRWDPGDVALVCTDGVSDRLDADALATLVLDAPSVGAAAQDIVDRAIELGGDDNATVVLVHRSE